MLSVSHDIVELSSDSDSGDDFANGAALSRPLTDDSRGENMKKHAAALSVDDEDVDSEDEWEEDSMIDDAIEDLSDGELRDGGMFVAL